MDFFRSIISSEDSNKKNQITLIYEDKETKVSWYADTSFEDTKLALTCACDALCDTEFEILDLQAKPLNFDEISELKDGAVYFLRKKKQEDIKEVKTSNILLDGKRKLLVQIDPLRHLEAQVAIKYILVGSNLLKHPLKGFPHIRLFQVSQDLRRILWYTKNHPLSDSQVSFDSIQDIVVGQSSDKFVRYPLPMLEEFSFSIYYLHKSGETYTLDITCKDSREFDLWLIGLKALHAHFNNKIICKDELLHHSRSYCDQIKNGNISNCSKFLTYSDEKHDKQSKNQNSLDKIIVSRGMTTNDTCTLILRLTNKLREYRLDVLELTSEEAYEENEGKEEGYEEVFADEAIADDTETQKNKMCNLLVESENDMGKVIHEFLWYHKTYKFNSNFIIDESEYNEFSDNISELEMQSNTFTNGKNDVFDIENINSEFFLKEIDIKLWKLEIDIENIGDIINRFKFPAKKGFFDKLKEFF